MKAAKYPYTTLILNTLESSFSQPRMARYVNLAGGDKALALELHAWNAELGGSLHLPMQHFELLLRNSLDNQLTASYGADWFDVLYPQFRPEFQRQIDAAKDELVKQRRLALPSAIISQFTLGAWVALLAPCYDQLLWKFCLFKAFPNRPTPFSRKIAKSALERIRLLRNRVVHHEPIYHRHLDRDLGHIVEVASWICPLTASWIDYHCCAFKRIWIAMPRLDSEPT